MYREKKRKLIQHGRARANENNTFELTIAYRDCVRATECVYLCRKEVEANIHGAICIASFDACTQQTIDRRTVFYAYEFLYMHLVSRSIFMSCCFPRIHHI